MEFCRGSAALERGESGQIEGPDTFDVEGGWEIRVGDAGAWPPARAKVYALHILHGSGYEGESVINARRTYAGLTAASFVASQKSIKCHLHVCESS